MSERLEVRIDLTKVLISIVICLTIILCAYLLRTQDSKDYCSKEELFQHGDWVGMYNKADGYYCVITDNRTDKDIERTRVHEECHNLVNENYDHFCTDIDFR